MAFVINPYAFPTTLAKVLAKTDRWDESRDAIKDAGYRIVDGKAAINGGEYFPAREGGGYSDPVACRHAVTLTRGTPASHAMVAVK